MADYYTFVRWTAQARGQQMTVVGKPGVWGWDGFDPGSQALIEAADLEPGDSVLDLGCGTGVVGAFAAHLALRGQTTLVDCHLPALACAQRTLDANGIANAEVLLGDGVTGLPADASDRVLCHLPRGREVMEELIRGAARVLRPGGRLYFVASKDAGIKGAIRYARTLFGQCGVVRQRKGYHVALALRAPGLIVPAANDDGYTAQQVICDGLPTTMVSKPGVFAWAQLDGGTAALIAAMEVRNGERILDLGCGTGLIGLAAARRAPGSQVVLADADLRAVESARRTLAANSIANTEVVLSDCGSALFADGGQDAAPGFDVVLTNPPFHRGVGVDFDVAHQFVRDAARVMVRSGRLYLVANSHLRYDDIIRASFGRVTVAYEDPDYRVLAAVAPRGGGR